MGGGVTTTGAAAAAGLAVAVLARRVAPAGTTNSREDAPMAMGSMTAPVGSVKAPMSPMTPSCGGAMRVTPAVGVTGVGVTQAMESELEARGCWSTLAVAVTVSLPLFVPR